MTTIRLIFANGALDAAHSDAFQGVEKHGDVWRIAIPAKEAVSLHLQAEGKTNFEFLLAAHANLVLLENFKNGRSAVTVAQAPNSRLIHARFLENSIIQTILTLENDACYDAFYMVSGEKESQNKIDAALNGTGANIRTRSLALSKTPHSLSSQIAVTHNAPHTQSTQLCKAVADNDGRASLLSRTIVAPHAQKVDAQQTNNALLLSDDAVIVSKPELEIYADDVKCGHGSAIGNLDPLALFYLQSRGLPLEEARATLIRAFIGSLTDEIETTLFREHAQEKIEGWFNG